MLQVFAISRFRLVNVAFSHRARVACAPLRLTRARRVSGISHVSAAVFTSRRLPLSTDSIWPGQPYPLGATFDGAGVNFAIFSEVADSIDLCLFDDAAAETRLTLPESTGFVHHGYVPGLDVRPALRLSCERSLGTRSRPTLPALEAVARSIRPRGRGWCPMERSRFLVSLQRP